MSFEMSFEISFYHIFKSIFVSYYHISFYKNRSCCYGSPLRTLRLCIQHSLQNYNSLGESNSDSSSFYFLLAFYRYRDSLFISLDFFHVKLLLEVQKGLECFAPRGILFAVFEK